jgi:hypothetical protein
MTSIALGPLQHAFRRRTDDKSDHETEADRWPLPDDDGARCGKRRASRKGRADGGTGVWRVWGRGRRAHGLNRLVIASHLSTEERWTAGLLCDY